MLSKAKRIVVKVGSSLLASLTGGLNKCFMQKLTAELAALHNEGKEVILVTSGAVAAGCVELGITTRPQNVVTRQALAAVGQGLLMHEYNHLLTAHDVKCGQVLITRDIFTERSRYLHARNTLLELIKMRVIPIVNENDTVAIQELRLKVGDNDTISMIVSLLTDADILIILSDVEGLYDRNPSEVGAKLIERVDRILDVIGFAKDTKNLVGTGGMTTKLSAAQGSHLGAIPLVIAAGNTPNILYRVLSGENIGTFFAPSARKRNAREEWIGTSPTEGMILIDQGAVTALVAGKKSLLPIGVKDVVGQFSEGAIVSIQTLNHTEIARGLSNFTSQEIRLIAGKKSSECASILGVGVCQEEVVHRDNLVVFE